MIAIRIFMGPLFDRYNQAVLAAMALVGYGDEPVSAGCGPFRRYLLPSGPVVWSESRDGGTTS